MPLLEGSSILKKKKNLRVLTRVQPSAVPQPSTCPHLSKQNQRSNTIQVPFPSTHTHTQRPLEPRITPQPL